MKIKLTSLSYDCSQTMFECFSFIHVTLSLVHGLPPSLSDSLQEVKATGDQTKHSVTSRELYFICACEPLPRGFN